MCIATLQLQILECGAASPWGILPPVLRRTLKSRKKVPYNVVEDTAQERLMY